MTPAEAEERRILELARQVWSPSASDQERVLAALRTSVTGSGDRPEATRAGPEAAPQADPVLLPALGAARGGVAVWASRVLFAVAIASGSGAAGYWLGYRTAEREALSSSKSTPQPAARAPAEIVSGEVPPAPAPLESRTAPADAFAPRPSPRTAGRREPVVPSSPDAGASLEEEVRMLRRVDRALREQNQRLALALLEDLDARVPRGQLKEERFAAETTAKCALGHEPRPALLERFSNRHPRSAYLARVRQACASNADEEGERK